MAFAAEAVVAALARSALLTAGVLTLVAEVSLAEAAAPSLSCAKEWLEIAKQATINEVIAMRFIIPDFRLLENEGFFVPFILYQPYREFVTPFSEKFFRRSFQAVPQLFSFIGYRRADRYFIEP